MLLEGGPDYGVDPKNWPAEIRWGSAPGPGTLNKATARGAQQREGSAATAPYALHNWNFRGVQNAAEAARSGEEGRSIVVTRGKVLGGSSSVNGHVWNRGLKVDFEYWAKELGCPSWGWERCLPFFKRAETDLDYGEDPVAANLPLPLPYF